MAETLYADQLRIDDHYRLGEIQTDLGAAMLT